MDGMKMEQPARDLATAVHGGEGGLVFGRGFELQRENVAKSKMDDERRLVFY